MLGLEDASVGLFLLFLDCTRVKPSSSMMGLFLVGLVEGTVHVVVDCCVVEVVEAAEVVEGVVPVVDCSVIGVVELVELELGVPVVDDCSVMFVADELVVVAGVVLDDPGGVVFVAGVAGVVLDGAGGVLGDGFDGGRGPGGGQLL